jgi:hypothetical protein
MLVSLLQCNRDESDEVDMELVKQDALELHEAGEGSWGTDESVFNRILVRRSKRHMKALVQEYPIFSERTLDEALESELSGDFLKSCQTTVHALVDVVD